MTAERSSTSVNYRVGAFESAEIGGWQSEVSRLHGAFTISTPFESAYRGTLDWQATARHRLVRWRGQPERLVRDRAEIRRDERDNYELVAPTSGCLVVEQAGRRISLLPGDMVIVPLDRPIVCEHVGASAAIGLLTPSSSVAGHLARQADSLAVDGRTGLGNVALSMLKSITEQRDSLSARGFELACERVIDMCAVAAAESMTPGGHRDVTAQAVRRFVHDHAVDPDLSAAAVAAAVGWSLRHVQAALRDDGTSVSDLIRARRLELAQEKLTDPRLAGTSLAAIAAACGFTSHSVFCRAVRERYGASPTDLRRSMRA
ncbi:helix-turn-helix domain-containing protein [Gordonia sp. TBRC 11910]|uniref:Helix-turn-helix domain-containing protein n=1 Tax=Gordonia asplenii TaxID=2725283 RepID=A0A848L1K1_9ACTN|nr:AraC family transcriptional regulator [Gordonia asplenii]NMO04332.1 helix-turn-helix domain-containing protein [Gordonia asplenii]